MVQLLHITKGGFMERSRMVMIAVWVIVFGISGALVCKYYASQSPAAAVSAP